MAVVGLADDNAGHERAQSKGKSEQLRCPETNADRCDYHRQGEKFPGFSGSDPLQEPSEQACSNQEHEQDESDELAEHDTERQ